MITGYIGGIGTGKTMNAVRDAVETARRRGANLVSNITVTADVGAGSVVKLDIGHDGIDLDALMGVIGRSQDEGRGVVLLLDEVGILMPARFWSDFPIDLVYLLSQSRKEGVDLIYTAQAVEQVDSMLRLLTTYVWLVRCFPSPSIRRQERGKRPWLFIASKWKLAHIEKQGRRALSRRVWRYRRVWEGSYSTLERVRPPGRFRDRHRKRRGSESEAVLAPPAAELVGAVDGDRTGIPGLRTFRIHDDGVGAA